MIQTNNPIIRITILDNISNRNDGQGRHWSTSNKARKRLLTACKGARFERFEQGQWVQSSIKDCMVPSCMEVDMVATRILGPNQRLWDADSVLRGEFKQLLDSLVELKIIEDDGPKYIKHVLGTQNSNNRDIGPAFQIIIYERQLNE